MKIENNIGWTDATANAVIGCRGCELGERCYALNDTPARVHRANGVETFGPDSVRVPVKGFEAKLKAWNKLCICDKCHETFTICEAAGAMSKCNFCELGQGSLRPIRVFADSNSDWLDWPIADLARGLAAIQEARNLDIILCTKWPHLWKQRMDELVTYLEANATEDNLLDDILNWRLGLPVFKHLILLTSITSPKVISRVSHLVKIPALRHGLSMEPLWSEVGLRWLPTFDGAALKPRSQTEPTSTNEFDGLKKLSWVIVGGESGAQRQDCGVDAIENVARQCVEAGVPVWVKQDCAFKAGQQGRISDEISN